MIEKKKERDRPWNSLGFTPRAQFQRLRREREREVGREQRKTDISTHSTYTTTQGALLKLLPYHLRRFFFLCVRPPILSMICSICYAYIEIEIYFWFPFHLASRVQCESARRSKTVGKTQHTSTFNTHTRDEKHQQTKRRRRKTLPRCGVEDGQRRRTKKNRRVSGGVAH